jgi:hypothetical protein
MTCSPRHAALSTLPDRFGPADRAGLQSGCVPVGSAVSVFVFEGERSWSTIKNVPPDHSTPTHDFQPDHG